MARRILGRAAVIAVVGIGVLSAFGTAGAAAKSSPGAQRILRLSAQVAPMMALDHADVTITDADGHVVGTGQTVNAGAAEIAVGKGRLPFLISTSGGTVRGRPFDGRLQALTGRTTRADGIVRLSFVTTVAARYRALHGGTTRNIEQRVYKRLGLSQRLGWFQVQNGVHTLRGARMLKFARLRGGYDVVIDDLVARLGDGRRFPDFSGPKHDGLWIAGTTTTRASSTSPCPANILPPTNAAESAIVIQYGAYAAAGTATAIVTSDPYTLLTGVAGMMFATQPGMTNSSVIASITSQLTCISAQIAQVQQTLNKLTLVAELDPLQNCVSAIHSRWSDYQTAITDAANNPENPTYILSASNPNLSILFANILTMDSTICNSIINQTLFNGGGSSQPAWPTLLASYKSGTYLSTDTTAFEPVTVQNLQYFLQYYSTFEYQQAALMTDYYNWLNLTNNTSVYLESQQTSWGPACTKPPSLSDVDANGMSDSWCQWQQNIIDVWPGNTFTDEVANWKSNTSTDPNSIAGLAISAVPGSFGISATAWGNKATSFTTDYLNGHNIDEYDSRWNAANAYQSFNNQPAPKVAPPYQAYMARQAFATGSPKYGDLSGYTAFKSFFNEWLNATVTPATSTSPAVITPSASSDPGHVTFQILFADGEMYESNGGCGSSATTDSTTGTTIYKYGYYTVHNAMYSPSPWTSNTGGTLGGGSKTVSIGGTTTSGPAQDGCQSTPPIAWLKSRPWVQGGSWPNAPVITVPAGNAVSSTATLSATGCSGSCSWTVMPTPVTGAPLPQGLAISSTGTFSWPGAKSGQSASVQVIVGTPVPTQVLPGATQMMFSAPVILTVTAP
jgi:hypothetical protein